MVADGGNEFRISHRLNFAPINQMQRFRSRSKNSAIAVNEGGRSSASLCSVVVDVRIVQWWDVGSV